MNDFRAQKAAQARAKAAELYTRAEAGGDDLYRPEDLMHNAARWIEYAEWIESKIKGVA